MPETTASARPALLVLVRHGQSARNVAKKRNTFFLDDEARRAVRGIPDWRIPLTDEGRRQAAMTGQGLRQRYGSFDYVYHSGYARTHETTERILAAWPPGERAAMQVRVNPFIRERDAGYAYDMTTDEAEQAFPWLQEHWRTFGPWFGRPPGGESLSDVAGRVYLFLNMLFRDRAGQRVLAVTHGGTLRCFRFLLERWTFEDIAREWDTYRTPNCCVTTYTFAPPAGPALASLNEIFGDWA